MAAGFIGGIVAGLVLWSIQMQRSRRDLFSHKAMRRLAALGYLAGQPSAETVRILTEYVRWEPRPMLRRRAERMLRGMQKRLA